MISFQSSLGQDKTYEVSATSGSLLTLSPNGQFLAVHGYQPMGRDAFFAVERYLVLFDIAQEKPVGNFKESRAGTFQGLVFSENSKSLISCAPGPKSLTSQVTIWAIPSGEVTHTFIAKGGTRLLTNRWLVMCDEVREKTARVIDLKTEKEVAVIQGHEKPIKKYAASPDGKYLATSETQLDTQSIVKVWSLPSGKELFTIDRNPLVQKLIFLQNEATLAVTSGGREGTKFYELPSGKLLDSHPWVAAAAISPDGKMMAKFGDFPLFDPKTQTEKWQSDGLHVYSRQQRKVLTTFRTDLLPRRLAALEFSPDGRFLFGACYGLIYKWDISKLQP